jgi:hypothetical protein
MDRRLDPCFDELCIDPGKLGAADNRLAAVHVGLADFEEVQLDTALTVRLPLRSSDMNVLRCSGVVRRSMAPTGMVHTDQNASLIMRAILRVLVILRSIGRGLRMTVNRWPLTAISFSAGSFWYQLRIWFFRASRGCSTSAL